MMLYKSPKINLKESDPAIETKEFIIFQFTTPVPYLLYNVTSN